MESEGHTGKLEDAIQPFKGTTRYEVVRTLGSGAAGIVYEAWDRERQRSVALKLLHQADPTTLYRFKQEFRALAHITHPNLVPLYGLQNEDDNWFVTMELIHGVDFVSYVRDPRVVARGIAALEERVSAAGRQLAQGIAALHAAGRLHRDVKPSNVLVDAEGHVSILDFGMVTMAPSNQTYKSVSEDILGTPAYMAPEQGAGDELDVTEAADWYAVGTLLYEGMLGEPPFAGQFVQVMLAKQRGEPKPLKEYFPEISDHLDQLCRDLLRREPEKRPRAMDILERLGSQEARRHLSTLSPTSVSLVGRDDHLAELWKAFDRLENEEARTVFVHGASGLGKTVLVRRFLDEVRARDEHAVTLSGRCYENETVPYKALDSVVDQLTRFLRSRPYREAAALLPLDVLVLARLFPVLKRVKAVADSRRRVLEIPDSHELRRRAFNALREILTRIAEDQPLVIFIDDLQWGDADSALLLAEIMRPPDPPPMLLLGAYRDEDAADSDFLKALRRELAASLDDTHSGTSGRIVVQYLEVAELSNAEAKVLTTNLLGAEAPSAEEVAEVIARDSHGHPLFVDELVRYVLTQGELSPEEESVRKSQVGSLDEVLRARIETMPRQARDILNILAVAGQPMNPDVARRAAEVDGDEMTAFTQLRLGRMTRSSGRRQEERIEVWNSRVREAVLATLDPSHRMVCHLRLARELEASGEREPERLAHHFAAAGETARALEYIGEAAKISSKALAFNRAARLYRQALAIVAEHPSTGVIEHTRDLSKSLADVLVNAGRAAEAAEVFLELSEDTTIVAEALDLRRQAAYLWLISGHFDKGLETLWDVLALEGMKRTDKSRFSLYLRRLRLRVRGLGFTRRDASQVPAAALAKIDTCWSAAIGLALIDTMRGADFQSRHLLLALQAGEPYRVARAVALEVGYAAVSGEPPGRVRELIRVAGDMVRQCDEPHAFGLATLTRGIAAVLEGRFRDSLEILTEAEEILRDRCTGVIWELDNTHFFSLIALLYLGEVEELQRRLPAQLKGARERGDLYAWTSMETRIGWFVHLTLDEPERGRTVLEEAIARWSRRGPHLQHLWSLFGGVEIDLYEGQPAEARRRLNQGWQDFDDLFKVQGIRIEGIFLRTRAALALAAERPEKAEDLLAEVARDAAEISKVRSNWGAPQGLLIKAAVAAGRKKTEEAVRLLAEAENGFEKVDLNLHAAAARRRRGELLGTAGTDLVARSNTWMTKQQIRSPERMTNLLAPGSWLP